MQQFHQPSNNNNNNASRATGDVIGESNSPVSTYLDKVEERAARWQGLVAIVRDGIKADGIVYGHLAIALMAVRRITVEVLATARTLISPTFRICEEISGN